MMDAVIVNYTQDQINSTLNSLNVLYSNLANKLLTNRKYSIGCTDVLFLAEVFMYRWALDGQLNYDLLTIEELNDIVNKVKDITSPC
jgi:hypothetical protein